MSRLKQRFVVILVELTNTVFLFVNSTNMSTNIETAVLSTETEMALSTFLDCTNTVLLWLEVNTER